VRQLRLGLYGLAGVLAALYCLAPLAGSESVGYRLGYANGRLEFIFGLPTLVRLVYTRLSSAGGAKRRSCASALSAETTRARRISTRHSSGRFPGAEQRVILDRLGARTVARR
jgi:hypothetical protein